MLHTLKCDLCKSIINIGFFAAMIITVILCFTADVYTDSSNEKVYSVFEAIFVLDKSVISSEISMASVIIFSKALTGFIRLFMPIIAAFPFVVSFCSERNSGFMRFAIARSGKNVYCISKFFSAVISGGLAVTLGVLLFGIAAAVLFSPLSNYDAGTELLSIIIPSGVPITVIKVFVSAFVYGATAVLPAFFLSAFCRNPYIITCIPFLLTYVLDTALNKLNSAYIENGDYDKIKALMPFYPDSLAQIIGGERFGTTEIIVCIVNAIYFAAVLTGFIIIMNRRMDKGV